MPFYNQILGTHILAGIVALVTFWVAAAMRKGTPRHRQTGQIFLLAMVGVCVTAVGLAYAAFRAHQVVKGVFLLYLLVITATPCWLAWRAIRDKHDISRFAGPTFHVLAWVNFAAAVALVVVAVRAHVYLLAAASVVAFVSAPAMLMFAARKPNDRRWWLVQHYGSIVGCGTATHIAFLSLGLLRMLPPELATMAPVIGGTVPFAGALIARLWLDRKYGPRSPAQPGAAVAQASGAS